MTVQEKIKSQPDVLYCFKEFPFYNTYIEKPKIKSLKSIDLLSELPFYEGLNVIKADHAFKGYVMSYIVELVEKNDPLVQLKTTKSSIKDLFNDLLDETKDLKYQITLKVEFKNMEKLHFLQSILIQQQKQ